MKEPVVPSPRKINSEKNIGDKFEVPAQNIATQLQPSPRKRDHLSPSGNKSNVFFFYFVVA